MERSQPDAGLQQTINCNRRGKENDGKRKDLSVSGKRELLFQKVEEYLAWYKFSEE